MVPHLASSAGFHLAVYFSCSMPIRLRLSSVDTHGRSDHAPSSMVTHGLVLQSYRRKRKPDEVKTQGNSLSLGNSNPTLVLRLRIQLSLAGVLESNVQYKEYRYASLAYYNRTRANGNTVQC